ncbi:hypothetical protein [Actinocorallia sp. A-T 12471]|uniref:hypothetical protein n=1 Tax=Actinocorallia sp. A-T 12471 TaxID=3089813 RepID=UPI0029CBCBC4|nr:hypothetical protein [Actinocorallia sp. A-T 12471]MDX6740143.1 hypothetical protein [Actinocorallia sp. A-T 12471]
MRLRLGGKAPRRWSRAWFERWRSAPVARVVLALARTTTSAIRLLEALSVFEDTDVLVVFACDDGSAFSSGAEHVIRSAGWVVVPWPEVRRLDYDLVLTASENSDLRGVRAPVVVLPHGIGFHKQVPDSLSPGFRISGMVPARHLGRRDVSLVVSHPSQIAQVAEADPRLAERCVVIGDLALDRLAASLPYRGLYRSRLGVLPGQRLVTVSSTWAPDGVYGANSTLYRTLLADLPFDEYRVAAVVHPNVPAFEGSARLGQVLSDALHSGLVQVPPTSGWHAAVLASDLVVADHGSVGLYAAALDLPFALGSRPSRVVPGTPPDELARVAPLLDADLPLRPQVDAAIAAHRPDAHRRLADRMFAHRGEAADRLRAHLLGLLDLPVPTRPALRRRVPDPEPVVWGPFSHLVHSRVTGPGRVELVRYPFPACWEHGDPPEGFWGHLCWCEDDPTLPPTDKHFEGNASVSVRSRPAPRAEVEEWMADRFLSGAAVAAAPTPEGCLVGTFRGARVRCADADVAVAASAVYTLLRDRAPLTGRLEVTTGPRVHTLTLADGS